MRRCIVDRSGTHDNRSRFFPERQRCCSLPCYIRHNGVFIYPVKGIRCIDDLEDNWCLCHNQTILVFCCNHNRDVGSFHRIRSRRILGCQWCNRRLCCGRKCVDCTRHSLNKCRYLIHALHVSKLYFRLHLSDWIRCVRCLGQYLSRCAFWKLRLFANWTFWFRTGWLNGSTTRATKFVSESFLTRPVCLFPAMSFIESASHSYCAIPSRWMLSDAVQRPFFPKDGMFVLVNVFPLRSDTRWRRHEVPPSGKRHRSNDDEFCPCSSFELNVNDKFAFNMYRWQLWCQRIAGWKSSHWPIWLNRMFAWS